MPHTTYGPMTMQILYGHGVVRIERVYYLCKQSIYMLSGFPHVLYVKAFVDVRSKHAACM